MGVVQQQHQQQ